MIRRAIDLQVGEKGIVSDFESDDLPIKLLEMGCLPGSELEIKLLTPFNGPLVMRIADSDVAIRKDLASKILLEIQ